METIPLQSVCDPLVGDVGIEYRGMDVQLGLRVAHDHAEFRSFDGISSPSRLELTDVHLRSASRRPGRYH